MKVMLDSPDAILPTRAHKKDAGLDLYSTEEKIILPGESAVFDTGVHSELPPDTYGHMIAKSGLAFKYDIVCIGYAIDEGYTGSIAVKLHNLGKRPYMVLKKQKIVQLVIIPCEKPELEVVERLEETERGENGFGSSGM